MLNTDEEKAQIVRKFHNWVAYNVLVAIVSTDEVPLDFENDETKDDCALMVIFISMFFRANDYCGVDVIAMMMALKKAILYLYFQNVIDHEDFFVTDHEKFHDVLCLIEKEKCYKLLFACWDRKMKNTNFAIDKKFIEGLTPTISQ